MIELVKALHVIQDECKKHEDCDDCPMSMDEIHMCSVTDLSPDNWKINDEVQKALL